MNTPAPSSFPAPPNFEELKEQLLPVLHLIRVAMQEGTVHVPEYFKSEAAPIDYALAPNLVRYKAKRFLIASGQDSAKDEESYFEAEAISNNGICIRVPGFEIRVLKSTDEGSVPPPGISITRQNLYNQIQAKFAFVKPEWGVIVHWYVDKDYSLLKVSVAIPSSFAKNDQGKQEVVCYFDEPFWIRTAKPSVTSIDKQPQVTDQDVPGIRLEDQDEKIGEGPQRE